MLEQFIAFLIISVILHVHRNFDHYSAPLERRLSDWLDERELRRLEREIIGRKR